jgi:hypothetical protein
MTVTCNVGGYTYDCRVVLSGLISLSFDTDPDFLSASCTEFDQVTPRILQTRSARRGDLE